MKQILSYFIVIFSVVLAALSGGNVEQARLEVNEEVTTESKSVSCTLYNHTGRYISYEPGDFSIEKKTNGEWIPLEYKEFASKHHLSHSARKLKSTVYAPIYFLYDPLEIGEYRVVFNYLIENPSFGNAYANTLYAEFEVTR